VWTYARAELDPKFYAGSGLCWGKVPITVLRSTASKIA
jgi:hypothetical protein